MKHIIGSMTLIVSLTFTPSIRAQDAEYAPRHELAPGTELIMVYVGSSTCGPCLQPETKAAVRELKNVFSQRAASRDQLFATMGVSLDWDVETGYGFLNDVAPWDEVIVGKSWTNIAASRLLWSADSVKAAIPQVMILERDVDPHQSRIEISEYRLIGQYFGIPDWLAEGAPLDR